MSCRFCEIATGYIVFEDDLSLASPGLSASVYRSHAAHPQSAL